MDKSDTNSLYKEILTMFFGGAVVTMIGWFFWLPEIVASEDALVYQMLQHTLVRIYLPSVIVFFLLTEITGSIGQVDKVWSVIPTVCCWHLTFVEWQWNGFSSVNKKYLMMSSLVSLWSVKMVTGLWTRGGIHFPCVWRGHEDYRWAAVRAKAPGLFSNRLLSTCFNFGFICGYQLLLMCTFSGVVFMACVAKDRKTGQEGLTAADIIIGSLMFFLIVIEDVADRQQQRYQRGKKEWLSLSESDKTSQPDESGYKLGFYMNGLFAYSRHPNFLCEQAIWVTFYLFSVDFNILLKVDNATKLFGIGGVFNFTSVGFILLLLMFSKSTDLTEEISSSKYKGYKVYQQHVPKLLNVAGALKRLLCGVEPDTDWKKQLE